MRSPTKTAAHPRPALNGLGIDVILNEAAGDS